MEHFSTSHWTSTQDEKGMVWLTFDKQGDNTNTFTQEALDQLSVWIHQLQTDSTVQGLVIQSAKLNTFIAGADIGELKEIQEPEAALAFIQKGQAVFQELQDLPFPTVALIKGYCLGGGLELALACRYRVAIEHSKTQLGLPEVKLGIHPGWGGTVRLPRLIGGWKAMGLILTGKAVSAKAAYKLGLVDAVVPLRQGKEAVYHFLLNQPKAHTPTFLEKISNESFVRQLLGAVLEKKLKEKLNKEHYPAPFMALQNWIRTDVRSSVAFATEANAVSQLFLNDTSKNLIRVYSLQEQLKALGKTESQTVFQVHVIGAGTMGGDIAAWCALKGLQVTLQDQKGEVIAKALARASALFQKHLKEPHKVREAMDRLIPDLEGYGAYKADLIIEAIVEKVEAKQALFKRLASIVKKEAILATNTSTIPLEHLSEDPSIQKRLIGLHFFNPVAKMPLVEVVESPYTSPELARQAMAFVRLIEKLPLPVQSKPGFLVNRVLMPYLLESLWLLESGVPATLIDKAAVHFGMAMGPIELIDTVGLDVCLFAIESLQRGIAAPIPASLKKIVQEGHLGVKSGQGFYRYPHGRAVKPKANPQYSLAEDVCDRLILSMANSAVACLRENVVPSADYVDAAMIYGAGFPPFRGGLLHAIEVTGREVACEKLKGFSERYGERFLPDTGWLEL